MTLTPAGLLVLAALALAGIAAQWTPWFAANLLWQLLALLVLVLFAADAAAARRRRLIVRSPGRKILPLGRTVPIELALGCSDAATAILELRPQLPPGLQSDESVRRLSVTPERDTPLTIGVRATTLGHAHWQSMPVRCRGPLGLSWWHRELRPDVRLRVVPDPATRALPTWASRSAGQRLAAFPGAGNEVLQIRPYRPGDPGRAIDWKATARSGQLAAREFTVDQHQEIVLAIDVGRSSAVEFEGLTRLGHFANLASQLIALAARERSSVGVLAFADKPVFVCPPVSAATAASRLQNAIAGLVSHPVESSPLLAMLRLRRLVRHRAMVVLFTDLDDPSSGSQLAQAIGILARKHLPLLVDLKSPEIEALADAPANDPADAYIGVAALDYTSRVQANCARLGRLGCRVVLSPPAAAADALSRAYLDLKLMRPN